jgi:ankyrin repeat protein
MKSIDVYRCPDDGDLTLKDPTQTWEGVAISYAVNANLRYDSPTAQPMAIGVFGDSFSWTPLDKPLVITRPASTGLAQEVVVKLTDPGCETLAAGSGGVASALSQDEARRELVRRKIKYDEEEFVGRARVGNREVVKLFLAAGMNVDARNKRGLTPLMAAAGPWPGHADVLCVLLGADADVNARDPEGQTALIHSAGMVNSRIMELLLDKGADVNAQANNGWTALMTAARSGQANTVKVLLDAGADVRLKNNEGKTALSVAFRQEGNTVVSLLEKAAKAAAAAPRR